MNQEAGSSRATGWLEDSSSVNVSARMTHLGQDIPAGGPSTCRLESASIGAS